MIDILKDSIAGTLKAIVNTKVYDEEVPNGMAIPAWLIETYQETPRPGINTRQHTRVRVIVSYFPADGVNSITECQAKAEELNLVRVVGTTTKFKLKNREVSITDKVLHYGFDVSYREIPGSSAQKMNTLQAETILEG